MKKGAAKYIGRVLIQRILGLLLYLLGAGWVLSFRAAAYFIIYFLMAVVSNVVLYHIAPETLAQRRKTDTGSPVWDKVLLCVYWILGFFVIYLLAGLEATKMAVAGCAFWAGAALQLPASLFALCALAVNPFLESTARLQDERGQTVCKTGPYRLVRHPMYASILLWCVSVSLMFGTLLVLLCAVVIAGVILVRTALEDRMLRTGLSGYAEYAQEVRWRLLPYVW